jgi:hypothetical protein
MAALFLAAADAADTKRVPLSSSHTFSSCMHAERLLTDGSRMPQNFAGYEKKFILLCCKFTHFLDGSSQAVNRKFYYMFIICSIPKKIWHCVQQEKRERERKET